MMNREEILKFKEGLDELNVYLSEKQYKQFHMFFDMLQEKNKVMNLTAITDGVGIVQKHFIDSLTIVKAEDMMEIDNMIDIGTGAGFPAIPIKIAFPHVEMVLVDSLDKRVNFVNEVIEALDLKKIRCIHGRAEDLGHDPQLREKFDLCVSRAVANLAVLAEYCMPFVKPQKGSFVAYKAGDLHEEIDMARNSVNMMGGEIKQEIGFFLPYSDISRSLIWIQKEMRTPKMYPRKAGIPSKSPIE